MIKNWDEVKKTGKEIKTFKMLDESLGLFRSTGSREGN